MTRGTWKSRRGFLLAAVGSAVGLGNVWRFPFAVGEGGGGTFLYVYLFCVLAVGFPLILVELAVGRRTGKSVVGALMEVGEGVWEYLGWLLVATAFLLLSYYTVVAGWVLRYTASGFVDEYPSSVDVASARFADVAVGLDTVLFHGVFMAATVVIVALGLRRGIELAAKVMLPALVILLVGMAYYAYGLPGAGEAYAYYLVPDLSSFADNWTTVLPTALGQAFFNLGLGMGIILTYASYIDREEDLVEDAGVIIALDTAISFVVGLVVFPVLFTAGVPPSGSGHGTVLVSMSTAFGNISGGNAVGVLFFGTVVVAALLSAVSLLEVVVSYMLEQEEFARSRRGTTASVGFGLFLVGIPASVSLSFFSVYDLFIDRVLLVLGALLLTAYVGWRYGDEALDEVLRGTDGRQSFGRAWLWTVRYPAVIILVFVFLLGITDYVEMVQGIAEGFLE
ncbi:MAG: sodium-dependent transporter [Halobacteriales archaeon]